jgi:hypothetical protein
MVAKSKAHKLGAWEYTEADLERMFEESDRRGKDTMAREIRAKDAHYDIKSKRLVINLENGTTVILPIHLLNEFDGASVQEMAGVELRPRGAALHWHKLDLDFGVAGLMAAAIGANAPKPKRRRRVAS